MVLLEGATVGAYRIVGMLGEGSLATAYKAYHPALDRHVTLKVLKAAPNDDPSLRVRFQHEARQVARLDHPNIVPVHDFLEIDGLLYMVMKFVDGETLRDRLKRGHLFLARHAPLRPEVQHHHGTEVVGQLHGLTVERKAGR